MKILYLLYFFIAIKPSIWQTLKGKYTCVERIKDSICAFTEATGPLGGLSEPGHPLELVGQVHM